MGVSVRYQAVPARSPFYLRLQQDCAFHSLLTALFSCGAGVFNFLTSEPAEAEAVLEEAVARHPEVLGSAAEARQRVAEFRAELERTRREFPGIEAQFVSISGVGHGGDV